MTSILKKISVLFIPIMVILAAASFQIASADSHTSYPDVPETNPHYNSVVELSEQRVIEGYKNGKYGVWDPVKRMQVAVMLANVLELETPNNIPNTLKAYSDIDEQFAYAEEVAAVTKAGIFKGNNGRFNPTEHITREQMASVLTSGFSLESYDAGQDVVAQLGNVSRPHIDNVQTLLNLGISVEPYHFNPKDGISRGAFASMLYRTQQMESDSDNGANGRLKVEIVDAITNSQIRVRFQDLAQTLTFELDHELEQGKNSVTFMYRGHEYTAEIMYDQSFEKQVVDLTNKERRRHGLDPLKIDPKLSKAASVKSHDMSIHQYFDHYSPVIGTLSDLLEQVDIDNWAAAGENIAKGYRTPESVMNGWMNSKGHRENILNPTYDHIGVGFAKEGHYWTQEFIKKR